FLTIWASNDPGQLGACTTQQVFIDNVPGATGQPHARLPEASHFLQDDQGEQIARRLLRWYVDGSATAKRTQRQKGRKIVIRVRVKARENLEAEISGRIKANRTYRLKTRTRNVIKGTRLTVRLKPGKKRQARRIAKALKNGTKARATLTVELTDETGNEKTEKLGVKLTR
ncbi:MAG: hypothetical protein WBW44_12650, partial [Solirubrobacterales bacterium]